VILPKALAGARDVHDHFGIRRQRGGHQRGGGNYFPVARDDWYPNNPGSSFGEFVTYDMTFPPFRRNADRPLLPSAWSESNDGGENVTVWKSEAPQTVPASASVNSKWSRQSWKSREYFIQSFANEESPDWVQALKVSRAGRRFQSSNLGMLRAREGNSRVALGSMNTTGAQQGNLWPRASWRCSCIRNYFGPSLFKHLQITQQTACNFGQSWPELVWIPICYYFDDTVRHQLRMDLGRPGYWKV